MAAPSVGRTSLAGATVVYSALHVRPETFDGAATFSLNVLNCLPEALPEARIVALVNENESRIVPRPNLELLRVSSAGSRSARRVLLETVWLTRELRRLRADVLLSPHESIPLRASCPIVVVAQNLVYSRPRESDQFRGGNFGQRSLSRAQAGYYHRRMATAYSTAARVVAISQHTARVLEAQAGLDPARTTVVHGGSDSMFLPDLPQETRLPRLLVVGTLAPYKNLHTTIDLLAALRRRGSDLELDLVGGDWRGYKAQLEQHVQQAGLKESVRFVGPVGPAGLATLYSTRLLLLHLSECESFGLPPLEAMRYGLPVVAADRSSLPEVTGGAAALADPDDLESLTSLVEGVLERRLEPLTELGRTRAAELTWAGTAQGLADVLKRTVVTS